jgi:hypothetical protein
LQTDQAQEKQRHAQPKGEQAIGAITPRHDEQTPDQLARRVIARRYIFRKLIRHPVILAYLGIYLNNDDAKTDLTKKPSSSSFLASYTKGVEQTEPNAFVTIKLRRSMMTAFH